MPSQAIKQSANTLRSDLPKSMKKLSSSRHYKMRAALRSDAVFIIVFSALIRGASAACIAITARNLNASGFGIYTYLVGTALAIAAVCNFGLHNALNRAIAARQVNTNQLVTFFYLAILASVTVAMLLTIAIHSSPRILGFASAEAILIGHEGELCCMALASGVLAVVCGTLSGLNLHRLSTICNALTQTGSAIAAMTASYFGDAWAAVDAYATVSLLGCTVTAAVAVKRCREQETNSAVLSCVATDFYKLLKFGLLTILGSIVMQPILWVTTTQLLSLPNGLVAVGLINLAFQFRQIILFIPASLGNWMLSVYAARSSDDAVQQSNAGRLLLNHIYIQTFATILLALPLAILAPIILKKMGSDYVSAVMTCRVMIVSASILTLSNIFSRFAQGSGDAAAGFYFDLMWLVGYLLAVTYRWTDLTAQSMAYAHLAGGLVQLLYSGAITYRRLHVPDLRRKNSRLN